VQIEKFNFKYGDLDIRRKNLILAMGYTSKPAPPHLDEDIDEVLSKGEELCEIEGGYRIVDNVGWNKDDFSLTVENKTLLIKKIIFHQIKKATSVAVFACTAGHKISKLSKKLMKDGELLKGYVYDVFGSVVVERAMDLIQNYLKHNLIKDGLKITNRFSPGYCGWDVAGQKNLFSLLPKKFCGIELNESSLMKPIKSVSGIIGIGKAVKFNPYSCDLCNMENCLYKNLN
jgi:hypothetical protein